MAIVLFTDFGSRDPYVGQVKGVLHARAPGVPLIDLLNDVPPFRVKSAAHLLAALAPRFAADSVFLAVVDPGVGSDRGAVAVRAGSRWFVGPDNGLLSVAAARLGNAEYRRILWSPPALSASFHGRDLFAPVAAWLAAGDLSAAHLAALDRPPIDFGPDDLPELIFIDHYGNAFTGLRAGEQPEDALLIVRDHRVRHARVFSKASGEPFWYANSAGLIEIALNQASAAEQLGLQLGDPVSFA